MKKLILIVFMAVIAIGFSTSAYGQLNPQAVECLSADALHPIAGQPYDYEITVPTPPGPTGTAWTSLHYNWFVTQNPAYFIQNGALLPPAAIEPPTGGELMEWTGGSQYNVLYNGAGTTNTINLTWKAFAYDPAEPVFVAILVTGENGVPCAMNNLKVYKIEPLHAFTLDIDNLTEAGANHTPGDSVTHVNYGDNLDVCISDVQGAVYDPIENAIDYDYGIDTIYFEVVAANWYDRWEIGVEISGLISDSAQTAQIDWAYAPIARPIVYNTLLWNVVTAAGSTNGAYESAILVQPQNGTNAVGPGGESVVVRVIVEHGTQWDGVYDNPINVAVNGIMAHQDAGGVWVVGAWDVEGDIHWTDDGAGLCPWFDMYANDVSLQTLKARPNVLPVNPTPFLDQGQ